MGQTNAKCSVNLVKNRTGNSKIEIKQPLMDEPVKIRPGTIYFFLLDLDENRVNFLDSHRESLGVVRRSVFNAMHNKNLSHFHFLAPLSDLTHSSL